MDRDVQRTRQRTVRWLNCSQAVSSAKPFQAFSSSSVQASAHECQPGTGSLCRSLSNNSSLPSFWEYFRFRILNHVLFFALQLDAAGDAAFFGKLRRAGDDCYGSGPRDVITTGYL